MLWAHKKEAANSGCKARAAKSGNSKGIWESMMARLSIYKDLNTSFVFIIRGYIFIVENNDSFQKKKQKQKPLTQR